MMTRVLLKSSYIKLLKVRRSNFIYFVVILIILTLLIGCTSTSSNSYSPTPVEDTNDSEHSSIKDQNNYSANSQLTLGEFIKLLMNEIDNSSRDDNFEHDVAMAKAKEYCKSTSKLNSYITIQEVAQILVNTQSDIQKYDISQFDWQIFDLDEADKHFRTSVIDAYANGLLTTQDGYIHPKKTVLYQDANLIFERLNDKSKCILPQGMKTPYYEYKGMVELTCLDPTILIDLKYATTNNFTGKKHYSKPLCIMDADAAKSLVKANSCFKKDGYFIKIWDAYRPVEIQWALHDAAPSNLKKYVPAPSKFSQHSKGIAADLTLVDIYQNEIPMPTGFDSFTNKAHLDYDNLPKDVIHNRQYLINGMKQAGFSVNNLEWWHYYLPDKSYLDISKVTFDEFIKHRDEYYLQIIKQKSKN